MQIVARPMDKISRLIADSFLQQIIHEPLRKDKLILEFSERHETVVEDNQATIRINTVDSVFQDTDIIPAFLHQELVRIKNRDMLVLPKFLEDIVCGREAAKLYPKEYFQLCYLNLLKHKRLHSIHEFLDVNKHWIIFWPIDAYNAEFLKDAAKKISHDKRFETLCSDLFQAAKTRLWSNENLNKALRAYEQLISHASS